MNKKPKNSNILYLKFPIELLILGINIYSNFNIQLQQETLIIILRHGQVSNLQKTVIFKKIAKIRKLATKQYLRPFYDHCKSLS